MFYENTDDHIFWNYNADKGKGRSAYRGACACGEPPLNYADCTGRIERLPRIQQQQLQPPSQPQLQQPRLQQQQQLQPPSQPRSFTRPRSLTNPRPLNAEDDVASLPSGTPPPPTPQHSPQPQPANTADEKASGIDIYDYI